MPAVDVGGVTLYYEEAGKGRPVVFVHGIPTDYRAWGAQMGPFSKEFRAVSLSRRLASPNKNAPVGGPTATVQENAADLKTFVEKVCEGPVDLVGHSYGGFVCALLAASHGDLVRSLVLVEPAVSTLLVADQNSTLQVLGLLLRSPSVALSARRFQSGSLGPSLAALKEGHPAEAVELNVDGVQDLRGSFAKLPEETRKMMLDNAGTIAELGVPFPRFTSVDAGRIRCRTLVVNGGSSALWLRRIGALLGKSVPGAAVTELAGARHFPHMEKSEEFNEKVLSFLRRG